jgi:hypothetical protein
MKNKDLFESTQNKKYEFTSFLYDVRYIILLYIIGDISSTYYAINMQFGTEGNGILSSLFETYGMITTLVFLKTIFVLILYTVFLYKDNHKKIIKVNNKKVTGWYLIKNYLIILGIIICMNNFYVIIYNTFIIN